MALIEIDRHILSDIIDLIKKDKINYAKFSVCWNTLKDCGSRGDTLYWTPNNSPEKITLLKQIRKKFFSTIRISEKIIIDISISAAEKEALLVHLVSLVKEADTRKGTETGRIKKEVDTK